MATIVGDRVAVQARSVRAPERMGRWRRYWQSRRRATRCAGTVAGGASFRRQTARCASFQPKSDDQAPELPPRRGTTNRRPEQFPGAFPPPMFTTNPRLFPGRTTDAPTLVGGRTRASFGSPNRLVLAAWSALL
jgi:hypothetical protein